MVRKVCAPSVLVTSSEPPRRSTRKTVTGARVPIGKRPQSAGREREREHAEAVDRDTDHDRRSRCETGVALRDFHVTFG
jgi:hypothetical protein